jgi:DNA/RNA endonuclease G (NUC1)
MKKVYLGFIGLVLFAACFGFGFNTSAQSETGETGASSMVSPNLVISQFQTSGATAEDEFIEIHNTSTSSVDLNGYRLVYRSATGTNDISLAVWTTSVVIPAGGYYLVAADAYDGAANEDFTYFPATCSCSMGAAGGGLAIRNGAANTGAIIDSVGWGTATNAFIEGTKVIAPPTNAGQARLNNGCQDTDNNVNDFLVLNPSIPRNTATSPFPCNGGGTMIFASGSANPSTIVPGGTTLLTVTVSPATTPPSTGITVTGNLSVIGGAAAQQFFDNGTNGDVTPNDNIFSFQAATQVNIPGGSYNLPVVAADAEMRTANISITVTINAPQPNEDPLLLGNPSNAVTDVNQPTNYLMVKPQYTLSYHRDKGGPNWVAWRLDSSWLGDTERQDDFRPDTTLPAGWYRVLPTDYDFATTAMTRGHMTPSGDRTNSIPNNSATFLMTNMLPQIEQNNSGPWNNFEDYCRSLAQTGSELYIYSGGAGSRGTIANGRVNVPLVTWKVVLILPNGANDLERINKGTRTIAIVVPNQLPLSQSSPWRNFRTTVKAVESLTGYNFFTNVPANTRQLLKQKRDLQ